MVTCVESSPVVPCERTVWDIFINSIWGSSVRSGASEHERKRMAKGSQSFRKERSELRTAVQSESVEGEFESLALKMFRYQLRYNRIYQKYVNLLEVQPENVEQIEDIPFLPISFFKTHQIVTGARPGNAIVFRSSGTSGQQPSQHIVFDEKWYRSNALRCFWHAFSFELADAYFLALLPSYLERNDASLVHMARFFADGSLPLDDHFYLDDFRALDSVLNRLQTEGNPVILMGVTFALLDFARAHPGSFSNLTVIETGGMKGRGPELVRAKLHEQLAEGFSGSSIRSEYGMTELLSQAYWKNGVFRCPPMMRVFPREIEDPLQVAGWQKTAALNIVDLANIDSCAFLASDDLGRVREGGKEFEVLGRLDAAEIRGCNLMYAG